MRKITVNLYKFDELSDAAKEKARDWWRQANNESFGHDDPYFHEPELTAAKILGIEFATHPVRLHSGKDRQDPSIWWGLHTQGSGASFAGYYKYAPQCAKKIRAEFGTDKDLHAIADRLTEIQKRNGYQLTAKITTSGREVHKYAMDVETYDRNGNLVGGDDEETMTEIMRDFADWIYKRIDEEYTSQQEDEYVDDAITANEYEFTEDGQLA